MGHGRLPRAQQGGDLDLVLQALEGVVLAHHDGGQVTELVGAQDDLRARVGAEVEVAIAAAVLPRLTLAGLAVEHAALTRLGEVEVGPLLHEGLHVWLAGVGHGVVGQSPLAVLLPPVPALGLGHAVVGEVGQGDEGRAADATDHDDAGDLAHEVVRLEGGHLATGRRLEQVDAEGEEILERAGAGSAASEGLQPGTGGADGGGVPRRDAACPQQREQLAVGLGPALLAVADADDGVGALEGLGDGGQLADVLLLRREPDTRAVHQDVEHLVEGPGMIDRQVGAVEDGDVAALGSRASGHEGAHRRQGLLLVDEATHPGEDVGGDRVVLLLAQVLRDEADVAVDGLGPRLATAVLVGVAGVAGDVDEVAIRVDERPGVADNLGVHVWTFCGVGVCQRRPTMVCGLNWLTPPAPPEDSCRAGVAGPASPEGRPPCPPVWEKRGL